MGVCNLYKDWTISSEASNRGTFNDQWVMSVTHVGLQAIGSSHAEMRGFLMCIFIKVLMRNEE